MADTTVDTTVQGTLDQRSLRVGPAWVDESNGYVVYVDDNTDLVYQKTTNGGVSWETPVIVRTGTIVKSSIWFDKWTPGDAGATIHIAYSDQVLDDILYRSLDTSDDSLGTERTVFDGATFLVGNWSAGVVDITKARGGNLYIGFWGDNVGEFGFERSTDGGVTWDPRAQLADGNPVDGILLMPGNEADNQDIWCIYWDRPADEISLKIYDNSLDSWSETAIETGMADNVGFYQMSAAPRASDNHVILAAWSEFDTATADLRVWDVGGSGDIVAKTDVVANLAESAQVAVFVNQQNDDIYVAYLKGGTFQSTVDVKYKVSTDGGTVWGTEQAYSEAAAANLHNAWAGISVGDDGGKFQPTFFNTTLDDLFVNLVNDVDIAVAAPPAVAAGRPVRVGGAAVPTRGWKR